MRRLRRFTQLSGSERRMLFRALFVVVAARASLWILPAGKARKIVARAAAGAPTGSVEQVVWGVRAVSRYLPGATCLTQAIAAQSLLTHCGFPSQVEIGVAKEPDQVGDGSPSKNEVRRLHAHAWVVCQGQVVLGESHVERYNSLLVWAPQE
jgi:Transglutaminase-like superfamily